MIGQGMEVAIEQRGELEVYPNLDLACGSSVDVRPLVVGCTLEKVSQLRGGGGL
jgi:hypothetical protein